METDNYPIEQDRILSNYLKQHGVEPFYLERLVAACFARDYPSLMLGAPGGGSDQGRDITHITSDGKVTVWCVTTEGSPVRKLESDGLNVLRRFRDHYLGELTRIYLCTGSRLSNSVFDGITQTLRQEGARLASEG